MAKADLHLVQGERGRVEGAANGPSELPPNDRLPGRRHGRSLGYATAEYHETLSEIRRVAREQYAQTIRQRAHLRDLESQAAAQQVRLRALIKGSADVLEATSRYRRPV